MVANRGTHETVKMIDKNGPFFSARIEGFPQSVYFGLDPSCLLAQLSVFIVELSHLFGLLSQCTSMGGEWICAPQYVWHWYDRWRYASFQVTLNSYIT